MNIFKNKSIRAWVLYDWGSSAFACTVVAAFFPIFFKKFWSQGIDPQTSTFYLGLSMSLMALVMAVGAPILGSLADRGNFKKKGLLFFAAMGSLGTACLFLIPAGSWPLALLFYGVGYLGFAGGNLFYDALLVDVAEPEEFAKVSVLGFSWGYLGGGLLIIFHALLVTQPQWFGLSSPAEGALWAFLTVGLWWILFTVPIAQHVHEKIQKPKPATNKGFSAAFARLSITLKKVTQNKNLMLFLLAYFFYIDGVGTIYKMAVDFAMAIGMESSDLIKAIILVQFVGFPATLLFIKLAGRFGEKNSILLGVLVYALACTLGAGMQTSAHFFALAAVIGCVQGGVQALSRSLFGRLIPKDQAGEYFGFYNMMGRFSAVLGPFLVGVTAQWTQSSRASISTIVLLFIAGGFFLWRVEEPPMKGNTGL